MTDKSYHTINDFLNDSSFKNWALNKKLSDVIFWDSWIKKNLNKEKLVKEAKDIIIGIQFKKHRISKEQKHLAWNSLKKRLLDNT